MSGRKQFDEEAALDAAMHTFWTHGYEATSLSDLEAATGLNKSSLYNAWHCKETLYRKCLERYIRLYATPLGQALQADRFIDAVDGFFTLLAERLADAHLPPGCMVTGASRRAVAVSDPVPDLLQAELDSALTAWTRRCQSAIDEGELIGGVDARQLAAVLLSAARGMTLVQRAGEPDDLLALTVRGVRQLLKPYLADGLSGG